jgi:hypothetical protein
MHRGVAAKFQPHRFGDGSTISWVAVQRTGASNLIN